LNEIVSGDSARTELCRTQTKSHTIPDGLTAQ